MENYGCHKSMQSMMRTQAGRYLNSYPGRDSLSANRRIHRIARECLDGKCTEEELVELSASLTYREHAMDVAYSMLPIIGAIGAMAPYWAWDYHAWHRESTVLQQDGQREWTTGKLIKAHLIPRPTSSNQGRPYIKFVYYLCAALCATSTSNEENHGEN
ncbi:MAG: hypothetical protein M1823_000282 [Watsoniomyces obsoletus]|nr:MAG: hypothetical protein M1823_000282 [Watsoniomyces obsoletus]